MVSHRIATVVAAASLVSSVGAFMVPSSSLSFQSRSPRSSISSRQRQHQSELYGINQEHDGDESYPNTLMPSLRRRQRRASLTINQSSTPTADLITPKPARIIAITSSSRLAWNNLSPVDIINPFPLMDVDVPAELREPTTAAAAEVSQENSESKRHISRTDASLSIMLFCTILCSTFSLVLLPSVANQLFPHNPTAFVAAAASLAPLGGGAGKLVNGFVCERFGGRNSSAAYMMAMAALSVGLARAKSSAAIGCALAGLEFCKSIQWTSACAILGEGNVDENAMNKSIGLLSAAMAVGALVAKLMGSALLPIWPWQRIALAGAAASMMGAGSMLALGSKRDVAMAVANKPPKVSPIVSAKNTLRSGIFWKVGIAHSIGYLVLASDVLLGSFTSTISSLPASVCAALSSSVTLGFVHGMLKGNKFSAMTQSRDKARMIRGNYRLAGWSAFGLALLGTSGFRQATRVPAMLATAFSGVMASCVAFQYFQIPNLVARTVFSEHSSVSMSFMDAVAFLVTAQALSVNRFLLSRFGWSASWMFLAGMVGLGGSLMNSAMPQVLRQSDEPRTPTNNESERMSQIITGPFESDESLIKRAFSSR